MLDSKDGSNETVILTVWQDRAGQRYVDEPCSLKPVR